MSEVSRSQSMLGSRGEDGRAEGREKARGSLFLKHEGKLGLENGPAEARHGGQPAVNQR